MARSWTRLHEHLGLRPGPLAYEVIAAAVGDKLAEKDDLDWKGALPNFARTPGVWSEFAKDVAAMANTRGGLLVYGVSDDLELVGIDLATVNRKQLLDTVRNGIQPYISGIDFIDLRAPGGAGPDLLVVDIPASELAPHFQYGWEQKDKDRVTFNAPYRVNDNTFYMTEHQVARAYQERFARQAAADALLKDRLAETCESVLDESRGPTAWLVIVAALVRPIPRMVPAPSRAEARSVLLQAARTASEIKDAFDGPAVMTDALTNDMRVGLRRWVDSSFLVPDIRTSGRGVMVELHHDGAVTVSADLSHGLEGIEDLERDPRGIAVNTQTLQSVVREAVALTDTFRQHQAADSLVDITATVATEESDRRLVPFGSGRGAFAVLHNTRRPRRLRPSSTQLMPNADADVLLDCAHELAAGLLHQFGINVHR